MTDRSEDEMPLDPVSRDWTTAAPGRGRRKADQSRAIRERGDSSPRGLDLDEDAAATRENTLGTVGLPWMRALQDLMRPTAFGSGTAHFSFGLREDRLSWGDLKIFAERLQKDVVFLEFTEPLAGDPPHILVAFRGKKSVTLFEDCELWALNHWTSAEILTPERRFKIDDESGRLRSRPNNLDEMRARRVALTHQRWKALAAEFATKGLTGWTAIPREMFSAANPLKMSEEPS